MNKPEKNRPQILRYFKETKAGRVAGPLIVGSAIGLIAGAANQNPWTGVAIGTLFGGATAFFSRPEKISEEKPETLGRNRNIGNLVLAATVGVAGFMFGGAIGHEVSKSHGIASFAGAVIGAVAGFVGVRSQRYK